MQVLIAPDSFGGTLTASQVAEAFIEGWCTVRGSDVVRAMPLSDGGEGLLEVVSRHMPGARQRWMEVAGSDGRPCQTPVLWLDDKTALLESATICGLPPAGSPRRPLSATSYGIGQALGLVASEGATHIVLGLGGTGVVDGGSGALNGLGMRLTVADGSGLRIGTGDLADCVAVDRGWSKWPDGITLDLLADTEAVLADAVPRFGPQKGVLPEQVAPLGAALAAWERVLCTSFPGPVDGTAPMTGAAGGVGFALAVALGGRLVSGSTWVADRLGLAAAVAEADLVVTGEGRLDATSATGKVLSVVSRLVAREDGLWAAVVGSVESGAPEALGIPADRVVTAPAVGPGPAAEEAVREAARILAERVTSVHSSSETA